SSILNMNSNFDNGSDNSRLTTILNPFAEPLDTSIFRAELKKTSQSPHLKELTPPRANVQCIKPEEHIDTSNENLDCNSDESEEEVVLVGTSISNYSVMNHKRS
ncbi:6351_t:CDS:1, partial [Acaulospora morrowiae]